MTLRREVEGSPQRRHRGEPESESRPSILRCPEKTNRGRALTPHRLSPRPSSHRAEHKKHYSLGAAHIPGAGQATGHAFLRRIPAPGGGCYIPTAQVSEEQVRGVPLAQRGSPCPRGNFTWSPNNSNSTTHFLDSHSDHLSLHHLLKMSYCSLQARSQSQILSLPKMKF